MKVISKIAIVFAVGLIASAGLSNVHAFCNDAATFSSNYFDAPIGQDATAAAGTFWGIGQFDPAAGAGSDSGLTPALAWLVYTPGSGFYLAGDWAGNPGYDGCVQTGANPQPARMGAVFSTSDGSDTYFVALCATEDASGNFDASGFLEIAGVPMSQVPKPRINASSRAGNLTNVTVGLEPATGGVYNAGACTLAVTGYRIYQQTVPRNSGAPAGTRTPGGPWQVLGTSVGPDVQAQVNCAVDSDIYLMSTLIFDGNVELKQGSRNATKVECGPNVANPSDDDFRIIRRPKSLKGR